MPVTRQNLEDLPSTPGVYIMRDVTGKVIYVGKAVVLKNRVRQYFNNSPKLPKVQAMVDNVDRFEYVITLTEKDALSLEANLVKKYNPHYNILLKDDKASPYIRIDTREEFPTVEVTRKLKKDGAKYYGPYLNGLRVWDIVGIIRTAFGMRTCKKRMPKKQCLYYHIGLCKAPCGGLISKEEYKQVVDRVIEFLCGKDDGIKELLESKMMSAADADDFEQAIVYREQLKMLKLLRERSVANLGKVVDVDSFAIASNGMHGAASVNIVRGGKMMGVYNFALGDAADTEAEALSSFAVAFYSANHEIPDEVCFPVEFDASGLSEYLSTVSGKKVHITFPEKGAKRQLIKMAKDNAADFLEKSAEKQLRREYMTSGAAERLKNILGLQSVRRMECFDISHVSGVDKVASQVTFIDGEPSKKDYRRYKIRTVEGNNDFACMAEVISRRMDNGDLPDLIVIDGGKGQLGYAMEAMHSAGVDIPMISLAERNEEIYVPGKSDPIILTKNDYALRLLQRIRDEAHRFAITYHRNLHAKRVSSSVLDEIDGVGPHKRNILLKTFSSVDRLSHATVDELSSINGIDRNTAQKIFNYFRENGDEI